MSSQKNSGQTKYANSNLNGVFTKSTSSSGPATAGSSINRISGMLVLPKRTRTAATGAGPKLSVPKPVVLPSIRKEHAGNDPTTQIVPAGTGGSWTKPDEQPGTPQTEAARQNSLTASSTWAAQPRPTGAPWHPPPPPATAAPPFASAAPKASYPVDRHLNPEEYPSLAATVKAQSQTQHKPAGKPGSESQTDARNWADDERAVPAAPPFRSGGGGEWSQRESERFEDERYLPDKGADYGGRAPWDRSYQRGDYDLGYGPERRSGPAFPEAEYDFTDYPPFQPPPPPRANQPYQPPPPPPRERSHDRYESGRYGLEYSDNRALFPPAPPRQMQPPPPPREADVAEAAEDDKDPAKAVWLALLDQTAAEMHKKKSEEPSRAGESASVSAADEMPPSDEPVSEVSRDEPEPSIPEPEAKVEPPAGSPAQASTPEVAASATATTEAPKPRVAPRSRTEEEEEERQRKLNAAEKLRLLDQQIAERREREERQQAAERAAAEAKAAKEAAEAARTATAAAAASAAMQGVIAAVPAAQDDEETWEDQQPVVKGVLLAVEMEEDIALPPLPPAAPPPPPPPPPPPRPPPEAMPEKPPPPAHHPVSAWQQPPPPSFKPPPPMGGALTTKFGSFETKFGSFDDPPVESASRTPAAMSSQMQPAPQLMMAPQPPPPPPNAWGTVPRADNTVHPGPLKDAPEPEMQVRMPHATHDSWRSDGPRGDDGRQDGGRSVGGREPRGRGGRAREPRARGARGGRDEVDYPRAPVDPREPRGRQLSDTDGPALGRGRGRGRGEGRAPARGRGGRPGYWTGSMEEGMGLEDGPKPTLEDADTQSGGEDGASIGAETDFTEVKSKKAGRVGSGSQPAPPPLAPAARAPGPGRGPGRGDRGAGRGSTLGPSGPPPASSSSATAAAAAAAALHPTAPGPAGASALAPKLQALELAKPPTPPTAPQNIPRRSEASSEQAYSWGANIAKDVAQMTLDDPVPAAEVVHLPATLDPTPPVKLALGFDRQIGPRNQSMGPKELGNGMMGTLGADLSAPPLGNGMPQLPADLNDIMQGPPVKQNLSFPPAPGPPPPLQSPAVRPLSTQFGFAPGPESIPNSQSMQMWGAPHQLTFGQLTPPPGMQHHMPQGPPNLGPPGDSFYGGGPPMFPPSSLAAVSQGGVSTAPMQQPLMLNLSMNQFGQFAQPFGAPGHFAPPTQFGTLGNAFPQLPQLVPTNKQPDWSITPQFAMAPQNQLAGNPGLVRPSGLDPMMASFLGSDPGFPPASSALGPLGPQQHPMQFQQPKQVGQQGMSMKLLPNNMGGPGPAPGHVGQMQGQHGGAPAPPPPKENVGGLKPVSLPDDVFGMEVPAPQALSSGGPPHQSGLKMPPGITPPGPRPTPMAPNPSAQAPGRGPGRGDRGGRPGRGPERMDRMQNGPPTMGPSGRGPRMPPPSQGGMQPRQGGQQGAAPPPTGHGRPESAGSLQEAMEYAEQRAAGRGGRGGRGPPPARMAGGRGAASAPPPPNKTMWAPKTGAPPPHGAANGGPKQATRSDTR